MKRIASIDILRGLVMVIMALDHVRDFFHANGMSVNPLDPETTTPALYLTRWMTHYCAPVFVFLSGISAWLSGRNKPLAQQSLFLIQRGLWLILIEVTIITFGWSFNPFHNLMVFQVIWAIGASMIALGLMIRLPKTIFILITGAILLLHNLLDQYEALPNFHPGFIYDLLHHGHFIAYPLWGNHALLVVYPVLPWIGIMAVGFAIGPIFSDVYTAVQRKKILLNSGIGLIALFLILRLSHFYGDAHDWKTWPTLSQTIMAFLDTTKYPPSLLFTCMTIGPALIFLSLFHDTKNTFTNWMTSFGKVPFFYYVLHIYLIHLLSVGLFFIQGFGAADIVPPFGPFWFRPDALGFQLPGVYATWILVIFLLYFPCKWYDHYRKGKSHWIYKYI